MADFRDEDSSSSSGTGVATSVPSASDAVCLTCKKPAAIERLTADNRSAGNSCIVCPYVEKIGKSPLDFLPQSRTFLEGILALKATRRDSLYDFRKKLDAYLERGGTQRRQAYATLATRLQMRISRRKRAYVDTRMLNGDRLLEALASLLQDTTASPDRFVDEVMSILPMALYSEGTMSRRTSRRHALAMFRAIINEPGKGLTVPRALSIAGQPASRMTKTEMAAAGITEPDADAATETDNVSDASSGQDEDDGQSESDNTSATEGSFRVDRTGLRIRKNYRTSRLQRAILSYLAADERRKSNSLDLDTVAFGNEIVNKMLEFAQLIPQSQQLLWIEFLEFLRDNYSPTAEQSRVSWRKLKGSALKRINRNKTEEQRLLSFQANKEYQSVNYHQAAQVLWGLYREYAKIGELRTQTRKESKNKAEVRKDIQKIYRNVLDTYTRVIGDQATATLKVDAIFEEMFRALLTYFNPQQ